MLDDQTLDQEYQPHLDQLDDSNRNSNRYSKGLSEVGNKFDSRMSIAESSSLDNLGGPNSISRFNLDTITSNLLPSDQQQRLSCSSTSSSEEIHVTVASKSSTDISQPRNLEETFNIESEKSIDNCNYEEHQGNTRVHNSIRNYNNNNLQQQQQTLQEETQIKADYDTDSYFPSSSPPNSATAVSCWSNSSSTGSSTPSTSGYIDGKPEESLRVPGLVENSVTDCANSSVNISLEIENIDRTHQSQHPIASATNSGDNNLTMVPMAHPSEQNQSISNYPTPTAKNLAGDQRPSQNQMPLNFSHDLLQHSANSQHHSSLRMHPHQFDQMDIKPSLPGSFDFGDANNSLMQSAAVASVGAAVWKNPMALNHLKPVIGTTGGSSDHPALTSSNDLNSTFSSWAHGNNLGHAPLAVHAAAAAHHNHHHHHHHHQSSASAAGMTHSILDSQHLIGYSQHHQRSSLQMPSQVDLVSSGLSAKGHQTSAADQAATSFMLSSISHQQMSAAAAAVSSVSNQVGVGGSSNSSLGASSGSQSNNSSSMGSTNNNNNGFGCQPTPSDSNLHLNNLRSHSLIDGHHHNAVGPPTYSLNNFDNQFYNTHNSSPSSSSASRSDSRSHLNQIKPTLSIAGTTDRPSMQPMPLTSHQNLHQVHQQNHHLHPHHHHHLHHNNHNHHHHHQLGAYQHHNLGNQVATLQPTTSSQVVVAASGSGLSSKGLGSFRCSMCGEVFTLRTLYQSHLKTHSQERGSKAKFQCELCGHSFSQKTSLNRHMKSHTGERPFPCEVCAKAFSEKERLKIHMRTHTGEKPFSCNICGKSFSQKSTVKRHQTVHTGEKKFRCDCGKGFANRGNLIAHIKTRGANHFE